MRKLPCHRKNRSKKMAKSKKVRQTDMLVVDTAL